MRNFLSNVAGGIVASIIFLLINIGYDFFQKHKFYNLFYGLSFMEFLKEKILSKDKLQKKGISLSYNELVNLDPSGKKYNLPKKGLPGTFFGPTNIAGTCEIRAINYLSTAFSKNDVGTTICDDNNLNIEPFIIALGSKNRYAVSIMARLGLVINNILTPYGSSHGDCGLIIFGTTTSESIEIVCAGLTETGTSASAYYLASHWKEILKARDEKGITPNCPFYIVVQTPSDQEATKLDCVKI